MSFLDAVDTVSFKGIDIFISPYSIAISLRMTLAGETLSSKRKSELKEVLDISLKKLIL